MSISRARALRGNPPEPERQMWRLLHSLRHQGYHFRRQAQIGPYNADFACLHAHLVIEADGGTHTTELDEEYDRRRDSYLRSRGYQVLRFWSGEVMSTPGGVFHVVAEALEDLSPLTPTPDPSPQGGGRRRNRRLRTGLAELAARTGDSPTGRKAQLVLSRARGSGDDDDA